ncbi:MAG: hypothetical protein WBO73_19740 [Gammaproteobacteria bacterium]
MNQQQDRREFVHRIDRDGRIRSVNEPWLAFAAENGWRTSVSQVLGSVLMEQITDPETRHIYSLLINRAWDEGRQARFNYRCDSPDCRRFMEMRIDHNRDLGQVEFRSRVLQLERREPVNLFDPCYLKRSSEILKVCGWCKAVWIGHDWVEVEQAVERLGLLTAAVLPQISHGICPSCSQRMGRVGLCS